MNGSFELLEHTADIGIAARGKSLEELFGAAARALMAVISQKAPVEARQEKTVEVTGEELDELLVNWLNEILFLFESGFFPACFEIEAAERTVLKAKVRGEAFDPGRHPIEREVKAATYHLIRVEQQGGEWHARVYLDL